MEASFPSLVERTVASALLLLSGESSSVPSPSSKKRKCEDSESFVMCDSRSCASSSTVTGDGGSSEFTHGNSLQIVADVAQHRHELKLKVVRKSRSKRLRISDCRKMSSGKRSFLPSAITPETMSQASSSIVSSGSSSVSSAGSCNYITTSTPQKSKPALGSGPLSRRSDAILRILSYGRASEVRIRQLLGDSPDTSKALRMLLKQEVVKRSGAGGRVDPFIYQIA